MAAIAGQPGDMGLPRSQRGDSSGRAHIEMCGVVMSLLAWQAAVSARGPVDGLGTAGSHADDPLVARVVVRLPAEVWLDAAGLARRISVNSGPAAAGAQPWSVVELWDFGVAAGIAPPGPGEVLAPSEALRLAGRGGNARAERANRFALRAAGARL